MANIIGYGDQMVKLEAYGDQLVGPVPLPSSPGDLESIYNALAAKGVTPASESLADILTAINTIVVPSGTYTYPSGSTGGTVNVTNYAQVNASNVYAKGKADGAISVTSQSRSSTVPSGAGRWYSITFTFSFAHGVLGVSRLRSGINSSYPDYNIWRGVPCLDISGNNVNIVVNGMDMVGMRIDITAQGY